MTHLPPSNSDGINHSERYLGRMCRRTFLSVWGYQNLHRNQGGTALGGKGKELCDVLVVFDKHVIIFSDKECQFPNSDSITLAWSRWHKRAVLESAAQLHGAERWLRKYPDRVFTDQACSRQLPITVPTGPDVRYHRVAVAGGACKACADHFGERGTLLISPDEPPPRFERHGAPITTPFAVGDVDPHLPFVHVFDDLAMTIVLSELDTVSDFAAYLIARESIVRSGRLGMAAGEEELLAYYIRNRFLGTHNAFSKFSKYSMVVLESGLWDELVANPNFQEKKLRDKQSYVWDSIIEDCAEAAKKGVLVPGSQGDPRQLEFMLRQLATSNRFERRMLAEHLVYTIEQAEQRGMRFASMHLPQDDSRAAYAFLAVKQESYMSTSDYRLYRQMYIDTYCRVVGLHHRHYRKVIGIATEARLGGRHSHDVIVFDNTKWTTDSEAEVREWQQKLDVLRLGRVVLRRSQPLEFPEAELKRRVGANEPCPCGSGKKYKKCCRK